MDPFIGDRKKLKNSKKFRIPKNDKQYTLGPQNVILRHLKFFRVSHVTEDHRRKSKSRGSFFKTPEVLLRPQREVSGCFDNSVRDLRKFFKSQKENVRRVQNFQPTILLRPSNEVSESPLGILGLVGTLGSQLNLRYL